MRYHRLTFDSIANGALRWTYLPWIESITHVKAGEEEELELRINSNYEKVWRTLKQRLDEPSVRLKKPILDPPLPMGKAVRGGQIQTSKHSHFAEDFGFGRDHGQFREGRSASTA
jgi:hypothetical protein